MSEPEYPVRVGDETFGPMPLSRLHADLESGALSHAAHIWDGSRWAPVVALLAIPPDALPGVAAGADGAAAEADGWTAETA